MWTDLQNTAMMGLQATANKRKYEMSTCGEAQSNCSPAKTSRWSTVTTQTTTTTISSPASPTPLPSGESSIAKLEAVAIPGEAWGAEPIVDSIQRLQAVAVPGETWGSDTTRSTLATTLLAADDLDDDDDDFEDDFEEEETAIPTYSPMRYPCSPPRGYIPPGYPKHFSYYKDSYPPHNCTKSPSPYFRAGPYGWNSSNYYNPPEAASPQQTIRCAENGKSYLELGSASYGPSNNISARHINNNNSNNNNNNSNNNNNNNKRCCDGKNNWCNSKQCYNERRLKMMNLSMFKLSRFRQVSEQSLYRSVLICNTLKLIEKEMEIENKETATASVEQTELNGPLYCIRVNGGDVVNNSQQQQQQQQDVMSQQQQHFSDNSNSNNSNNFSQSYNNRPATPAPQIQVVTSFNDTISHSSYDNHNHHHHHHHHHHHNNNHNHHPLRDSQSGRATPFPMLGLPDTDSGFGDEDCTRPINWGSVLSLSSQSALDPLNNNDLFSTTINSSATTIASPASYTYWDYSIFESDFGLEAGDLTELLPSWKLTPLSADDILKSVPPPMEPSKVMHDNEIDSFTHIMVGS